MGKQCCAGLLFIFFALLFLMQLVVAIFVVPINGQCDSNSVIPEDAPINLSMDDWIYGNMGTAILIFAIFCSGSRSNSDSDCAMAVLALIFILYNLFVFAWSIMGLVLYSHYYKEACSEVDKYNTILSLGLYTDLIYSSIVILFLIGICVMLCKTQGANADQERLINNPQVPPNQQPQPNSVQEVIRQNEYAKGAPRVENREPQPVLTDAEFQRQRGLYQNLYDRIMGRRQSHDYR